ncbi:MAG: hypothetical protein ACOC8N_06315 [Spirochaetota bacterium]
MPTLLFGGLTRAHDRLYQGAFASLGYRGEPLPPPDRDALNTGRIYCNKGQCNPVYYTAGSLINHLNELKRRGERDICNRYLFITAGSCGPCRFGMYEMEYRKALRDAGFGGLTVVALQQGEAMVRDLKHMGFSIRRRDFFTLLKPLILGDLINDLYYQVRPYETRPGAADRWREGSVDLVNRAMMSGTPVHRALKRAARNLREIPVDYLQPRPRVKIIGEFFSHIQEGDPSYRLPEWLVSEGAEPSLEPVTTWVDYLIWSRLRQAWARAFRAPLRSLKVMLLLGMLKGVIHAHYAFYRLVLGRKPRRLLRQSRIAALARPHYHPELSGGEGHMEVGKHVHAVLHRDAHLVISIKPFGCMPSTQSDGVQMKVMEELGSSFLSIDTSGDAEVNAKSRVAMKLQEAVGRVEADYRALLDRLGMSREEARRAAACRPDLARAHRRLPRRFTSTTENALLLAARGAGRRGAGRPRAKRPAEQSQERRSTSRGA